MSECGLCAAPMRPRRRCEPFCDRCAELIDEEVAVIPITKVMCTNLAERRPFLRLPVEERRRRLKRGAERLAAVYEEERSGLW